jgi:putative pyruvate formate lyase activating enzyme
MASAKVPRCHGILLNAPIKLTQPATFLVNVVLLPNFLVITKMYRPRIVRSTFSLRGNSLPANFAQRQPYRRKLHLAPPFLLDDYIPRYHQLSSIDASKKRSAAYAHLRNCNLCPRLCGVNRYEKTGTCLIGAETVKVNVIAPHFGEGK